MEKVYVLKRLVLLSLLRLVCIKGLNMNILENSKSPLALGVYVYMGLFIVIVESVPLNPLITANLGKDVLRMNIVDRVNVSWTLGDGPLQIGSAIAPAESKKEFKWWMNTKYGNKGLNRLLLTDSYGLQEKVDVRSYKINTSSK